MKCSTKSSGNNKNLIWFHKNAIVMITAHQVNQVSLHERTNYIEC